MAQLRDNRNFPFWRTLLVTLAIVFIIYAVYEVIDRLWLGTEDMETVHMLHGLRGFVAGLMAAALVGWLILRETQPLLTTALSPEDRIAGSPTRELERVRAYTRWFINMRWIAILVAVTLIVVTVRVAELLPATVWWPLISTAGVLILLNIVYTILLGLDRASKTLLATQAYIDLLMLTILLHFSGSLENPLAPLMLFHVIIAGIILSRQQCFSVAIAGSVLFALLASLELSGLLQHYTLAIFPHAEHGGHLMHASREPLYVASHVVLHGTILVLTAFFVTTLADQLRRDERQIERYAERISTERQLLTQALDTTGTALCVYDEQLEPMWHNRQWNNWFGNAREHTVFYDEIYGEGSAARQTVTDGRARVSEIELADEENPSSQPERVPRTFLTTTAPLTNAEGDINRVVQLAQDITEQKRTQAGLIRAGKLAAVGEMAGEVAHEVNNPVAIISAKARLLLSNNRDELPEKVADELQKITDLADRIARITQGLLSYSRPSAGVRQQIDLRLPIRKSMALAEQRALTNGVDVEDELPDEPLTVLGNSDELEQVFLNMFLNSIDAMREGGRLTIRAMQEDERHVIVIEYTGPGIDPAIRERIFEPFFTTKPEGEGTGLGLSICAGLIRSHGGSIELASEPGEGTTMRVILPASIAGAAKAAQGNG